VGVVIVVGAAAVRLTAPEEAAEHFGWIGAFFAVDAPASRALTQERLG
jgi:hypothetical protein